MARAQRGQEPALEDHGPRVCEFGAEKRTRILSCYGTLVVEHQLVPVQLCAAVTCDSTFRLNVGCEVSDVMAPEHGLNLINQT